MVTIRDVAREAGVSIATVSRVLNGSSKVNAETGRRVREAAARLDYWPNSAARSLTSSRTHTLGILLPDLFGEFFSEVIRGVDQAARRGKLQVLISSSHADSETMLAAARSMRGRIDGLIALAPDRVSVEAMIRLAEQVPVVLLSPRRPVEGLSSVSVASFEGAYAMVSHLLGLGHREIAMITGPAGNVDAEERLRGYRKALEDAGRGPRPALELPGDFTESSGYRAATRLLGQTPRPTAVFTANDYTALGLLSALRDLGVDVPGGMAVTGFDDIAISQYLNPPLTTVRVDAYELGQRAVDLWIAADAAGTGGEWRHEVLPAALVVRNSCGAAGERTLRPGARRGTGNGRGRELTLLSPRVAADQVPRVNPGPDGNGPDRQSGTRNVKREGTTDASRSRTLIQRTVPGEGADGAAERFLVTARSRTAVRKPKQG